MKAIIYTRWSPRPDADTTQATQAQLTICRNHCRVKDYEVAGEFSDEDVSGDDDTRVGLWQAVDALRRGYVLVVADGERLARDVELDRKIFREVGKRGARIEFVLGCNFEHGHNGDMMRTIIASVRERDKKEKAYVTHARMLAHQANGLLMSKHPPFGFAEGAPIRVEKPSGDIVIKRTIVPLQAEQAALARIRELQAQGLTPGRIASTLNAEAVACRGKRWHRETIRRALARG